MNKNISYKGISVNPSDYISPDGDLHFALNLIPENNSLSPVQSPGVVMPFPEDCQVIHIHQQPAYSHFIIYNAALHTLYWCDTDAVPDSPDGYPEMSQLQGFSGELPEISAIGNTLITSNSDGLSYFIWKDGSYLSLGSHLPELPISFGLRAQEAQSNSVSLSLQHEYTSGTTSIHDDDIDSVTSYALGCVNKFVADEATNKGRFIFPFFVRYAYRLFDGSTMMHSAPIFMNTCSGTCPDLFFKRNGKDYNCAAVALIHQLFYFLPDKTVLSTLENWSDIVKSVDIFISAPIYPYSPDGKCNMFDSKKTSFIGSKTTTCSPYGDHIAGFENGVFGDFNVDELLVYHHRGNDGTIRLPEKSEQDRKDSITRCANFYLLKSVPIAQLPKYNYYTSVEVPDDYLQSLTSREQMTDDYQSHHFPIAASSFIYNQRLNIADVALRYFDGFSPASLPCVCNAVVITSVDSNGVYSWRPLTTAAKSISTYYLVLISKNELSFWVKSPVYTANAYGYESYAYLPHFFFYPDAAAKKVIVVQTYTADGESVTRAYEAALTPHDHLNGAYFFNASRYYSTIYDASIPYYADPSVIPSPTDDPVIKFPNKIYASEVSNPFFFPLANIVTIGTGRIIGLASAAKALSQGQFGQFPLYAFTTEGVWALEISQSGIFSARQPITRDVCIDSKSITPIDSSVLFVSDRGIMILSGSQSSSISESLFSPFPEPLPEISHLQSIAEAYGFTVPATPFAEYIKACRMIYDYSNQRIIIYNPNEDFAYLFSLQSKAWGMMQVNIKNSFNAYPKALAMDSENNLIDFASAHDGYVPILLLSRPIKLEAPEDYKTISSLVHTGTFFTSQISVVLYGSRNLSSWHLVASSRNKFLRNFNGSPYKFFRILVAGDLHPHQKIHGAAIRFSHRLPNAF